MTQVEKMKMSVMAGEEDERLGSINFKGPFNKLGKHNGHKLRYAVLRGFKLYFYKKDNDFKAKYIIQLEPEQLLKKKIVDQDCFYFELHIKELKKSIKMIDDGLGRQWLQLLRNQVAYLKYLQMVQRGQMKLDLKSYFQNQN